MSINVCTSKKVEPTSRPTHTHESCCYTNPFWTLLILLPNMVRFHTNVQITLGIHPLKKGLGSIGFFFGNRFDEFLTFRSRKRQYNTQESSCHK